MKNSLQQKIDWVENQGLSQAMKGCMQEAEWHGEGDVWTHTLLVCEALSKLLENAEHAPFLDPITADTIEWAGVLHDIGKPSTTCMKNGRIRTYGHAKRGEKMANEILFEVLDVTRRASVCNLIRYHEKPFHIMDSDDDRAYVAFTSWLCSNYLLYLLATADAKGRVFAQTNDTLLVINCWKDVCQDNHCYSQLFPFRNDHARVLFYRGELSSFFYTPYAPEARIIMLSGLPGSGKTYHAINSQGLSSFPRVSLDAIRDDMGVSPTDDQGKVIQRAKEDCCEFLRGKTPFVFDATNLTRHIRAKWIKLFSDYDMGTEIIYFEPNMETILRQNALRDNAVSENVIRKLVAKMDIPNMGEAHSVQFVTLR